jgi:hypothetical protein
MDLAAGIAQSFQVAVQQADSKVAMLLIVHPGASLLVVSQLNGLGAVLGAGGLRAGLAIAALAVFAVAFAAVGVETFLALRPRITPPAPGNRFAFPAVAAGGRSPLEGTAEELARECWEHAEVLARIATVKNQHVLAATRWLLPGVVGAVACLALAG